MWRAIGLRSWINSLYLLLKLKHSNLDQEKNLRGNLVLNPNGNFKKNGKREN